MSAITAPFRSCLLLLAVSEQLEVQSILSQATASAVGSCQGWVGVNDCTNAGPSR